MSREVRDRDKYESGSKWFCDWHREQPFDDAKMIDLDGCGYCHICMYPLYLVEATESQTKKTATVTENLGRLAGLEVLVFYRDLERHPGEFLVDHRSAGLKPSWLSTDEAWEVLMSVRRTHVCSQGISPPMQIRDLQERLVAMEYENRALKYAIEEKAS